MGYPTVEKKQTQAFAKAWDKSGIKMILDDTSIQFATDYANIVLKSFVDDLAASARKKLQAAQAKGTPVEKVLAEPMPVKSKIVLTDI